MVHINIPERYYGCWGRNLTADDGYCIYGVCFTLGANEFWGATVITNLFSAFPVIGDYIVTFLWGGFSVDNPP